MEGKCASCDLTAESLKIRERGGWLRGDGAADPRCIRRCGRNAAPTWPCERRGAPFTEPAKRNNALLQPLPTWMMSHNHERSDWCSCNGSIVRPCIMSRISWLLLRIGPKPFVCNSLFRTRSHACIRGTALQWVFTLEFRVSCVRMKHPRSLFHKFKNLRPRSHCLPGLRRPQLQRCCHVAWPRLSRCCMRHGCISIVVAMDISPLG
jgi:hypothetical protein